ncbi:hypothetical protein G7046_g5344 [Stylonectria norvegica]|nr:hypothetical protein G7046_g5344 [Stylonectria norvegica]
MPQTPRRLTPRPPPATPSRRLLPWVPEIRARPLDVANDQNPDTLLQHALTWTAKIKTTNSNQDEVVADQFANIINKYPEPCRDDIITGVVDQVPKLRQVSRAAKTMMSPAAQRKKWRDRHETRTEKAQDDLDRAWGGPGWLPDNVRVAHTNQKCPDGIPGVKILEELCKVTDLAKSLEIPLMTLWEDDGQLRQVATPKLVKSSLEGVRKSLEQRVAEQQPIPHENQRQQSAVKRSERLNQGQSSANTGDRTESRLQIEDEFPHIDDVLASAEKTRGDPGRNPYSVRKDRSQALTPSHSNGRTDQLMCELGSASRFPPASELGIKRKRSPSINVIDLTGPIEGLEAKRTCPRPVEDLPLHRKVYDQLTTEEELTDDVMFAVSEILVARHRDSGVSLADPLWFKADSHLDDLPQKRQEQEAVGDSLPKILYVPMHHGDARHWSLLVVRFDESTVTAEMFDSSPSDSRAKAVQRRLGAWLQSYGDLREVKFVNKACPRQKDGVSCGVFALMFLRHLVSGTLFPPEPNPSTERLMLRAIIRESDPGCFTGEVAEVVKNMAKGKGKSRAFSKISLQKAPTQVNPSSNDTVEVVTLLTNVRPGQLEDLILKTETSLAEADRELSSAEASRERACGAAENNRRSQKLLETTVGRIERKAYGPSRKDSGVSTAETSAKDDHIDIDDAGEVAAFQSLLVGREVKTARSIHQRVFGTMETQVLADLNAANERHDTAVSEQARLKEDAKTLQHLAAFKGFLDATPNGHSKRFFLPLMHLVEEENAKAARGMAKKINEQRQASVPGEKP